MRSPYCRNGQKAVLFLPIYNKILVQQIFPSNKSIRKGEGSNKPWPHLSQLHLQDKAGTITALESKLNSVHLTFRFPRWLRVSAGRWEQSSGATCWCHCCAHQLQECPLLGCTDRFLGKGSWPQPGGTAAPHGSSLLAFCHSCSQGSCLQVCCAASLGWCKITPPQIDNRNFFYLGFEECKEVFCDPAAESALDWYDFWTWFLWSNFANCFNV